MRRRSAMVFVGMFSFHESSATGDWFPKQLTLRHEKTAQPLNRSTELIKSLHQRPDDQIPAVNQNEQQQLERG